MTKTAIEWTDEVWNPVTGCTKVSEGCRHCYAEAIANRWWGERPFTDVRVHADRLAAPLRWRAPRRVFVNSMSDLFHEAVPGDFVDHVFAVMALASRHTFQVLTKRPDRMRRYLAEPAVLYGTELAREEAIRVRLTSTYAPAGRYAARIPWPLPNVWLGVSVEDQSSADARVPHLLDVPAAVRFVSCEPLLAPIQIEPWFLCACLGAGCGECQGDPERSPLRWVIVGGESGPGHRPMDPAWARSLRDQCRAAGVPFFFKQSSGPRPGMGAELDGEAIQEFPL